MGMRIKKRRETHGQVSIEYLAVFSIALIITLPLIIIFVTQTNNLQADITNAEVNRIVSKIVDNAETVYFMGEPAQKTLAIDFPPGIQSIAVNSSFISFNVTTTDLNYVMVKETVANLTGSLRTFHGTHVIVFKAVNNTVLITDQ